MDFNPQAELKRLYTQLEVLKNKTIRADNPHISKRRGGRKVAHRRFSLQVRGASSCNAIPSHNCSSKWILMAHKWRTVSLHLWFPNSVTTWNLMLFKHPNSFFLHNLLLQISFSPSKHLEPILVQVNVQVVIHKKNFILKQNKVV